MLARNATRKLLSSSRAIAALPAATRFMSEGVKKTLIYDEHVKMGGNMVSCGICLRHVFLPECGSTS
jgi:hypothetical protein